MYTLCTIPRFAAAREQIESFPLGAEIDVVLWHAHWPELIWSHRDSREPFPCPCLSLTTGCRTGKLFSPSRSAALCGLVVSDVGGKRQQSAGAGWFFCGSLCQRRCGVEGALREPADEEFRDDDILDWSTVEVAGGVFVVVLIPTLAQLYIAKYRLSVDVLDKESCFSLSPTVASEHAMTKAMLTVAEKNIGFEQQRVSCCARRGKRGCATS